MCDELSLPTRLRMEAQNEQMIDSCYTEVGKLLMEAARELELQEEGLGRLRCMLADQNRELDKYHNWLNDQGRTVWACEKCGRARDAYGCLWCECQKLRRDNERLRHEAAQQGSEDFRRFNLGR